MNFPHPSIAEILISLQIFIVLYPVRWMLHKLESEAKKQRRTIIRRHVQEGHEDKLKTCHTNDCLMLSSTSEALTI